jgi:hypothetical protein
MKGFIAISPVYASGQRVEYVCAQDYWPVGGTVVLCVDGTFVGISPNCQLKCLVLISELCMICL